MAGYMQLVTVIIGVAIGFGSSVATNWISAKWRVKEEKEKDRHILIRQNVDDSLKYVFKINDIMTGIMSNMETYELAKLSFPEKAVEFEKKVFSEFEKKQQEGLQAELMFVSYKLNHIDDEALYNDFQNLINIQHTVINCLLQMDKKGHTEINPIYMMKLKHYVGKCIEKCKFNQQ